MGEQRAVDGLVGAVSRLAGAAVTGAMMDVVNPATGEVVDRLPESSPDEIESIVGRARVAQSDWARRTLDERRGAIRRFMEAMVADQERLARLLTTEVGKPISQSRNELRAMPERLRFFIDRSPEALAEEVVLAPDPSSDAAAATEEVIRYEPLGVVANISAWNYPWFVGSNVFVPALIAGNAVVYKPSEHASLTGLAIADLLHSAGVPEDVFTAVVGGGTIGAALVNAPVDGIFFTGSYATGRAIARAAAGRMIPVQLELGGKDPVYLMEDVDVEAAADAMAEGAFYNNGQSCCAVERIYVHRDVAPRFTEALAAKVSSLVVGDPADAETFIGPLAMSGQLEVLERQVADARARGGRVLCGGRRMPRPGWYFEPTVVSDASGGMLLMREETFGPLIGVQVVDDDDEALRMMNDTDYGLTAGVFSRDRERAERLLSQVDSGTAYWNCCDRVSPRLPWTGRKHSGIGSTLSLAGIRAFARPKAYHLRQPARGAT
jgi:acyl-CoA reductase-like NAD-dependent aldehyde dehydrogenase